MNSPIQYPGGKGRQKYLLDYRPKDFNTYVELFGGSGALLFAAAPSPIEVYNDNCELLVNLFDVLKDEELFNQFNRLVNLTLYSRQTFEFCRDNLHEPGLSKVEVAYRYFTAARQSYISAVSPMQSWSKTSKKASGSGNIGKWLSAIDRLPEIHHRLRHVQIECSDFEQIIITWDSESTFFYADPPYIGVDIYYQIPLHEHERIIKRLARVQGKVMISNYDNYPYNILDDIGWVRKEFQVHSYIDKSAPKRTEVIWMNYHV